MRECNFITETGKSEDLVTVVERNGRIGFSKKATIEDYLCEVDYAVIANAVGLEVCPVDWDPDSHRLISWYSGTPRIQTMDASNFQYDYQFLAKLNPQMKTELAKLMLVDCMSLQCDRHCENVKFYVGVDGQIMGLYPQYDNVACLSNSYSNQTLFAPDSSKIWSHDQVIQWLVLQDILPLQVIQKFTLGLADKLSDINKKSYIQKYKTYQLLLGLESTQEFC